MRRRLRRFEDEPLLVVRRDDPRRVGAVGRVHGVDVVIHAAVGVVSDPVEGQRIAAPRRIRRADRVRVDRRRRHTDHRQDIGALERVQLVGTAAARQNDGERDYGHCDGPTKDALVGGGMSTGIGAYVTQRPAPGDCSQFAQSHSSTLTNTRVLVMYRASEGRSIV